MSYDTSWTDLWDWAKRKGEQVQKEERQQDWGGKMRGAGRAAPEPKAPEDPRERNPNATSTVRELPDKLVVATAIPATSPHRRNRRASLVFRCRIRD